MSKARPQAMQLEQAELVADTAWDRYVSTCHTAGTAEQRRWAFDQAVNADQRAADLKHQPRGK